MKRDSPEGAVCMRQALLHPVDGPFFFLFSREGGLIYARLFHHYHHQRDLQVVVVLSFLTQITGQHPFQGESRRSGCILSLALPSRLLPALPLDKRDESNSITSFLSHRLSPVSQLISYPHRATRIPVTEHAHTHPIEYHLPFPVFVQI